MTEEKSPFESEVLERELLEFGPGVADAEAGGSEGSAGEEAGPVGGGDRSAQSARSKRKVSNLFGPTAVDIWDVPKKKIRRPRFGRTHGKTLPSEITQALGEAHAQYIQGDASSAIEAFSAVTKLAPRLPDPYNAMAMIYEEAGHRTEALQLYVLAATYTPKGLELWRKVSILAFELNLYDQAMSAVDYVLRYENAPVDAITQKVFICLKQNNSGKAFATLKKLLSKHPEEIDFLLEYAAECEGGELLGRASYAYIRYCIHMLAPYLSGLPSSILEKHHSVSTFAEASRTARIWGDEEIQTIFFAASRAVYFLLDITTEHTLVGVPAPGRSSGEAAVSLADFGVSNENLESAYRILSACVDAVAEMTNALPVDTVYKPSIPIDVAILLVLCHLYRSVEASASRRVGGGDATDKEAGSTELMQGLNLLGPLMMQLKSRGITMDASEPGGDGAGFVEDTNMMLGLVCIRILSILGHMGMLSLALRYADGLLSCFPAHVNRLCSVRSCLQLEVSLFLHRAARHEASLEYCLSAVSTSPNDVAALRFLTFLSTSMPATVDLSRRCLALHFDAISATFSALCNVGRNLMIVNNLNDSINDSPTIDVVSLETMTEYLKETFRRLVDSRSYTNVDRDESSTLSLPRVEAELDMVVRHGEAFLVDGDMSGFLSVGLPLVEIWLSHFEVDDMTDGASNRSDRMSMSRSEVLSGDQYKLSVCVVAMVVFLNSHGSRTTKSMPSTVKKLFKPDLLCRVVVAAAVCLWQLKLWDSAIGLLLKSFRRKDMFSYVKCIPEEVLQAVLEKIRDKSTDSDVEYFLTEALDVTTNKVTAPTDCAGLASFLKGRNVRDILRSERSDTATTTGELDAAGSEMTSAAASSTQRLGPGVSTAQTKLEIDNPYIKCSPELSTLLRNQSLLPHNIEASNKITRLLYGDMLSELVNEGYDAISTEMWIDVVSLEQVFSVQSFYRGNKGSTVAMLLSAHGLRLRKKHAEALDRYLAAFCSDSTQPLTSLCIAIHLIYLCTRPMLSRCRHETLCKAMAFLAHYVKLRLGCSLRDPPDVDATLIDSALANTTYTSIQQEVYYNMGRMFQEIDQLNLAQVYYHKVLEIVDGKDGTLGARCDYSRDAAFNLTRIFTHSGSSETINIALDLMRKHLTFE